MSFEKCKYRIDCRFYDQDAICCTYLNKLCVYGKHYERMERLADVHLSPKGIERCLTDLKDDLK